ncbi:MAG: hypothetical protein L6263_05645 [Desulfobacteraceae bacterium]|nr:hypothetical protein [Desulfobacteraceae bacterium]
MRFLKGIIISTVMTLKMLSEKKKLFNVVNNDINSIFKCKSMYRKGEDFS